MALITPQQLIDYTVLKEVKERPTDLLKQDIFEARVKVVDAAFDDVRRTADRVNADSVARDTNLSNILDRVNNESVTRDNSLRRDLDTFADEVRSRLSALESKVK